MGNLTICCGSFCGFFGKALRTKAALHALMFLCFFWTTFNIVLSSMTVTALFQVDPKRMNDFLPCSPSDYCSNGCQNYLQPPRPCNLIVTSPDDVVVIHIFCPWLISTNASRFCCSICCILMFTGMLIWAFRKPNSKPSKLYYAIPFIVADIWWWAVMVTDATEIIKSNNECNAVKQKIFILSNPSLVASVSLSQRFICSRSFLTSCVAVPHIQHSHLYCALRRRVRTIFLHPLDICLHVRKFPLTIDLRP
jgi:hypothetical protein